MIKAAFTFSLFMPYCDLAVAFRLFSSMSNRPTAYVSLTNFGPLPRSGPELKWERNPSLTSSLNPCPYLPPPLRRQVQRQRPHLRLVLSSATLQARALADFFQPPPRHAQPPGAPLREPALVSVEGQLHPVRVHYLEEPCRDYLEKAVATALEIHATQRPGDILVFLTGQVRHSPRFPAIRASRLSRESGLSSPLVTLMQAVTAEVREED